MVKVMMPRNSSATTFPSTIQSESLDVSRFYITKIYFPAMCNRPTAAELSMTKLGCLVLSFPRNADYDS
jgi:hypothetical protein